MVVGERKSGSGSLSESVSKGCGMGFGHEKLDVYAVHEDPAEYTTGLDPDPDSDPDTEGNQEQTDRQPLAPGDVADR